MGKKYLMAIDDSDSSTRIANYLKNLLKVDDQVTVYSVLSNPALLYDFNDPTISPILLENKVFFATLEKNEKKRISKILEKAKKILSNSGFDSDKIVIKLDTQNKTIAHHIVDEAVNGKYDSIVIGKHNSSRLTEVLLGDVTHRVIHLSKEIPVIVV